MTETSTLEAPCQVLSGNEIVEVRKDLNTGHKFIVATCAFKPGAVLCAFSARATFAEASRLTIQIGIDRHITLTPKFLQYTNHSCAPNIFFDPTAMRVIVLKAVTPGDELRFFYPSTEWEMAEPFACHCGAGNCLRSINGAAFMPVDVLRQYRLSDFIQQQLADRQAEVK